MMSLLQRARDESLRAAMLVALAVALAAPAADAQAPANGVRIIELTPHLAVNDAATLIEAEKYADAIVILDTFLATEPARPPEAFYLLGLAHYQLGDYAKALPPGGARGGGGGRCARELARARRRAAQATRRPPRGDSVAREARRA